MKHFLSHSVLWWLRICARIQLRKNHTPIVGITGSAGKSSAVSATALILQSKYVVKYTHKGNSETGIPLEILGLHVGTYNGFQWLTVCVLAAWKVLTNWETYQILVVEMGIDSEKPPKNMEYLLSIVRPSIGVFLSLYSVHAENFSGSNPLAAIAKEKGKLLVSLPKKGTAVYCTDFPEIVELAKDIKAHQQTFSLTSSRADITLLSYEVGMSGSTFKFSYKNQKYQLHFDHQIHSKASFGSFAAALLVAQQFDISVTAACTVLQEKFKLPPGRMSIIEGKKETVILDSSYNSSLGPTQSSLETLSLLPGRKIAVLGDMRELGIKTQEDHEALARSAIASADEIVFVGKSTGYYSYPIVQKSTKHKKHVYHVETAYEAVPLLENLIKPGDVILVKGSQNTIFLEIVVKALMKHPAQAKDVLCRQTPYWEQQRQKLKK